MSRLFLYALAFLLLAGVTASRRIEAVSMAMYTWEKTVDEGPWKKSYNFQMFSHRDTLWVFHSDGSWFWWMYSGLCASGQNLHDGRQVRWSGPQSSRLCVQQ